MILLATDEPPSKSYECPGFDTTAQAASAIGAKIIGIRGSGGDGDRVKSDLNKLATKKGGLPGAFGYGYDATRLGHRSMGTAVDLVLDYKFNANLALQGGYTYMWGHARFNNLSDDDVRFGYLQATLRY